MLNPTTTIPATFILVTEAEADKLLRENGRFYRKLTFQIDGEPQTTFNFFRDRKPTPEADNELVALKCGHGLWHVSRSLFKPYQQQPDFRSRPSSFEQTLTRSNPGRTDRQNLSTGHAVSPPDEVPRDSQPPTGLESCGSPGESTPSVKDMATVTGTKQIH